jgi:uncharacterized MAPEG superfamily protein
MGAEPQQTASPLGILALYLVLGGMISFLAGRDPGSLPKNIQRELAPTIIIICIFLISYSLIDVMAVGIAKQKTQYSNHKYNDLLKQQLPEEVHLAMRVQTNQVEQMPVFLVGSLTCALYVNGIVAGWMAGAWVILRRRYASVYRNALGIPVADIGLAKFTVPSYILANTMVMASAIHAFRCIVS